MKGHAFQQTGDLHIVRIDPGEDVLISLGSYLKENRIEQGVILGGYGTLAAYHLHWVNDNRIPSSNTFRKKEGGFELLSMSGLIVEGEPHIHVSISTIEGAFGGHLEEGCTAYVICELYFAEVQGRKLKRCKREVDIPGMGKGSVTALDL